MAGSFGFEHDHCDVSQAVGEQRLFPRVREAADDTLIVADGFSCREQIAQATGRRAVHLAEVLALARGRGARDDRLSRDWRERPPLWRIAAMLALAGGAILALQILRTERGTVQ